MFARVTFISSVLKNPLITSKPYSSALSTVKHSHKNNCLWSMSLRHLNYDSAFRDRPILKLKFYKRIFALTLFTTTFGIAWYAKNKKDKKLISSLKGCDRIPIDQSLFDAKVSMYRYKGFIFPGDIIFSGVFKELEEFKFRESDVIVASFPKTGTTWVQEIVYQLTHLNNKSKQDDRVLETRFPYLEYPFPGINTIINDKEQRFIKTHLPYSILPQSFSQTNPKLVYITRNPRDTAVSYFHFVRLLTLVGFCGSLQQFIDMFTNDKVPYSPFFEHIKSYLDHRSDNNILILTYETLSESPEETVKKIAQFLEVEVSEDDIQEVVYRTSFKTMSKNPNVNYEHWKEFGFAHKERGNFLRKGKTGSWKEEMSNTMIQQMDQWETRYLKDLDLSFTYEPSMQK